MNLGQIYYGMGRYDEAIKVLGAVRTRSQQWIPAQNRLGMVHWRKSRVLESRGDAAGAQAEAQKAIDALNVALKARRDAGTGQTDPGLIGNIGDLATVLSETGKPADALAAARSGHQGPDRQDRPRLTPCCMEAQLKAYIITGNVDAGDRLDQGARASRRGRRPGPALLQARQAARKRAGEPAGQEEHQGPGELSAAPTRRFLTTVAESKTGQTLRIARLGRLRACSLSTPTRTPRKYSAAC